ncbi:MAG: FAD binding domain-containing protein, partial [Acidobacteriota bacterium]|nr:FAD binding domain-containing protein [Acidobacteriota bacterium]
MKPAAFEYFRPATVDEAVELLGRYDPEVKILAGGQSLVPLMNYRLAQPRYLIDTNGIAGLSYIRANGNAIAIGAMTRHAMVEDSREIGRHCPLLTEAARCIGHRTIRNRATLGGSIAHADPSAEFPTVLSALDGEVTARGPGGDRAISARELFVTLFTTSIASNELLTEVRVPVLGPRTGWGWEELARRSGDYAIVGVGATLTVDDGAGGINAAPPLRIVSGNRRPAAYVIDPPPGSLYDAGQTVFFAGEAIDEEDGAIPCTAFSWTVLFHHLDHAHPFLGPIQGICAGSFETARVGEVSPHTSYEIRLDVADSGAPLGAEGRLDGTRSVSILPDLTTITIDTEPLPDL